MTVASAKIDLAKTTPCAGSLDCSEAKTSWRAEPGVKWDVELTELALVDDLNAGWSRTAGRVVARDVGASRGSGFVANPSVDGLDCGIPNTYRHGDD